jgi:type VI secretion system FHA domain protein
VFDDLLRDLVPPADATPDSQEIDLLIGDPTGFIERRGARRPAPSRTPKTLTVIELLSALYGGLGLPAPIPAEQSTHELQVIGGLLRTSIEGLLTLLAARAVAKRELGASSTLPQPRENNPLKFSPDTEAALAHLLGPVQRGFMPAQASVAEAFADLGSHEMALLAGMRAALNEVLARFDPASLEQRLAPKGRWDNLLPGGREAKLWGQFVERYADIVREIEGDFDSLSSRAFRDAYEAQLDKLTGREPDKGHRS